MIHSNIGSRSLQNHAKKCFKHIHNMEQLKSPQIIYSTVSCHLLRLDKGRKCKWLKELECKLIFIMKARFPMSCCKFWIYWVGVNTKFTTWHLIETSYKLPTSETMSSIQHEHLKHWIKQLKLLLKTEIIDSIGYNRVSLASHFKHFSKKKKTTCRLTAWFLCRARLGMDTASEKN